ncbi:hypothetical protein SAMN02745857_01873 [Andreprevotia lacus DSM 23236]|jgi:uncharacterized protein YaiI (UPF0178 family)|uniref:UPF0178 protein SAMN02745857_01873 n=1 Tax=Andreprevotia lacus DSM 23236 TaxID=1121001 RepID=A0A1W1XK50_9NEIS|nr:YaiI/YqxD family protein [Andreprevotia lacus]SMC24360.1 hypothetical protein SAMN02745857_01873 [Andreprevotia lacus DSM 23236]
MRIWVDADACPKVIREILCRAAERTQVELTFIANQLLTVPVSPYIRALQVPQGFDVADDEIARRVEAGDLVITGDIPLASEAIAKGAQVLDSRGEVMSTENIRERLTMRDFMETMRASGVQTGGPPALSAADKQRFARQLDIALARRPRH